LPPLARVMVKDPPSRSKLSQRRPTARYYIARATAEIRYPYATYVPTPYLNGIGEVS
jgi:hypothetical protein